MPGRFTAMAPTLLLLAGCGLALDLGPPDPAALAWDASAPSDASRRGDATHRDADPIAGDASGGTGDGGVPDGAGTREAGVADDASRDGGALDASPVDGRAVDAAPPDLTMECPPSPLLVGCYRFEGNCEDGSMYGNHASICQGSFAVGVQGQSLGTGVETSVVVEGTPSLAVEQLTLDMWVRPRQLPPTDADRAGLLEKDNTFGLYLHSEGAVRCVVGLGGPTAEVVTSPILDLGRWQHVACTYDGERLRVYVDGVAQNAAGAVGSISSSPGQNVHIAEAAPAGDDQFVGAIDTVRIWSEALGPDQLTLATTH